MRNKIIAERKNHCNLHFTEIDNTAQPERKLMYFILNKYFFTRDLIKKNYFSYSYWCSKSVYYYGWVLIYILAVIFISRLFRF